MTDTHSPEDTIPACRETLDEIVALWESISEVTPGGGAMPATLQDFTSVQTDAQVIDDASNAFDRLVSLHARTQALAEMTHRFLDHPATSTTFAGGTVLGVTALAYGLANGSVPAYPTHYDTFREAFTNSPIPTSLVALIGTASVAAFANELLDKGYARFTGLSDALHRLQDGAKPYANTLGESLAESERETYGEILKLGYQVAAAHDEATQHRFMEQIYQTMKSMVSRLESTPQAGMIQETLNSLKAALSDHPSLAEQRHEHAPFDPHYSTPTSPSL